VRCANHPDRIATDACALCGAYHCGDCLSEVHGDLVCARCEGAAREAGPAAASEAPTSERGATTTSSRWKSVALVATVTVLVAALVLLAIRPGRQRTEEPLWTAPDDEDQRNVEAIAALERAAIAVETYYAERGTYPTAWDDLVPDLAPEPPADPWGDAGATLRLRVPSWDPGGVVLYSVGPDGRDDGGRVYTPETGMGDLVYIVR